MGIEGYTSFGNAWLGSSVGPATTTGGGATGVTATGADLQAAQTSAQTAASAANLKR